MPWYGERKYMYLFDQQYLLNNCYPTWCPPRKANRSAVTSRRLTFRTAMVMTGSSFANAFRMGLASRGTSGTMRLESPAAARNKSSTPWQEARHQAP